MKTFSLAAPVFLSLNSITAQKGGKCDDKANPFQMVSYEDDLQNYLQLAVQYHLQELQEGNQIDNANLGIAFMNGVKSKLQNSNNSKAPCMLVNYAKILRNKDKNGTFRGINNDKKMKIDFNCEDKECDVGLDLRGLWGYGCWCNFGGSLTNGKGTPVSKHDEACKRMQLCLRCAEIDAGDGGYECDVKNVQYNSTLGQSLSGQNLNGNINGFNSGCEVQNPSDPCGAHVCTCEMQLVNEILGMVWDEEAYDPIWRRPSNPLGGDFDFEANCLSEPGVREIDCCGKYPYRYTYNTKARSCCDPVEELFNPVKDECCADGVYSIGSGAC